jgi:hypothetical protein
VWQIDARATRARRHGVLVPVPVIGIGIGIDG